MKAVQNFFFRGDIPRAVKATTIVLIPKVNSPQDFSQFCPISFCKFFNKIISKILVDRLTTLLPYLISLPQSGFIKGRMISDNYLLAQEIISGISRKNRGGNVALKLDMAKAYD